MIGYCVLSMTHSPELVEIISDLGQPPAGIDIETFAIANTEPGTLTKAAEYVTPNYEQLIYMRDTKPELYEYVTEQPQPEMRLGSSILDRQMRLSRTKRVAAVLLTSTTLATGAGAANYKVQKDVRQDFPSLKDDKPIVESIFVGGIGGLAGGFVASFAGLGFAPRFARGSARKIVRHAEEMQG